MYYLFFVYLKKIKEMHEWNEPFGAALILLSLVDLSLGFSLRGVRSFFPNCGEAAAPAPESSNKAFKGGCSVLFI